MELLLGCGNSRKKQITFPGVPNEWTQLTTLDFDPSADPHVLHDLNNITYPFDDEMFDEIHAYQVLEHCGHQGDWRFFFNQFMEFHRILKPGGYFCATCPCWDSPWAWGDPGHTRIISPEAIHYLSQASYEQVGQTSMADYREWYKADFEPMSMSEYDNGQSWAFVLRKI